MDLPLVRTETLYQRDQNLKKQDVEALMQWVNKQPHLPEINELQAIIFLHSCFYKNEAAKKTIDNFFTIKTHCPEFFKIRNSTLRAQIDTSLFKILPKKTPDGCSILLAKFLGNNPENFDYPKLVKYYDMVLMLHLFQEGPSEGYRIVLDMEEMTLGHLPKIAFHVKTFFLYLQEAMPIRLRGLHFLNTVSFIDKFLALIKPFMKKEVQEMLHLHDSVDKLSKLIPLECLPKDYGGLEDCVEVLHDDIRKKLDENEAFFEWEEQFVVDESKRVEKIKFDDLFGVDGTFKKLQID